MQQAPGQQPNDTSVDVLTEISTLGPGLTLQQLVTIFKNGGMSCADRPLPQVVKSCP